MPETPRWAYDLQPEIPVHIATNSEARVHPQARAHPLPIVDSYLQTHRAHFAAAEVRRRELATDAFRTLQQIFAIEECKRQEGFYTQLAKYTREAEEREAKNTSIFLKQQTERENLFQEGEAEREESFANLMKQRADPFRGKEDSLRSARVEGFSRAQNVESEHERGFAKWVLVEETKFWNRTLIWKTDFLSDERKRQQLFVEVVGS